jgi:hypothetical protein
MRVPLPSMRGILSSSLTGCEISDNNPSSSLGLAQFQRQLGPWPPSKNSLIEYLYLIPCHRE